MADVEDVGDEIPGGTSAAAGGGTTTAAVVKSFEFDLDTFFGRAAAAEVVFFLLALPRPLLRLASLLVTAGGDDDLDVFLERVRVFLFGGSSASSFGLSRLLPLRRLLGASVSLLNNLNAFFLPCFNLHRVAT